MLRRFKFMIYIILLTWPTNR